MRPTGLRWYVSISRQPSIPLGWDATDPNILMHRPKYRPSPVAWPAINHVAKYHAKYHAKYPRSAVPVENSPVGIFWDWENCMLPYDNLVASIRQIRSIAIKHGPLRSFKVYMRTPTSGPRTVRSAYRKLQHIFNVSGVDLHTCPSDDRKDVIERIIIQDMLTYAIDHPTPATLVLLSGDRDFSRPLAMLGQRRYRTVVIGSTDMHPSILALASEYHAWHDIVGPVHSDVASPISFVSEAEDVENAECVSKENMSDGKDEVIADSESQTVDVSSPNQLPASYYTPLIHMLKRHAAVGRFSVTLGALWADLRRQGGAVDASLSAKEYFRRAESLGIVKCDPPSPWTPGPINVSLGANSGRPLGRAVPDTRYHGTPSYYARRIQAVLWGTENVNGTKVDAAEVRRTEQRTAAGVDRIAQPVGTTTAVTTDSLSAADANPQPFSRLRLPSSPYEH